MQWIRVLKVIDFFLCIQNHGVSPFEIYYAWLESKSVFLLVPV